MNNKCPICKGNQFLQDPKGAYHYCYYCKGTGDDPGVARFFTYKYLIALTANQLLPNQRIVLNGDAPFRLKLLTNLSQFSFRIRLYDSNGQAYSSSGEGGTNDRVPASCLFGNGQLPFLVVPAIDIPAGGFIGFDLEDTSGVNNQVELAFHGEKLYPTPAAS